MTYQEVKEFAIANALDISIVNPGHIYEMVVEQIGKRKYVAMPKEGQEDGAYFYLS